MPASRAFSLPYACRPVCAVALLLAALASPSVRAQTASRTSFGKQTPGTVTELAPGAGGRIWATTRTAGLFRSDDGAARWTWIEPIPGQQEADSGLDSSWACGEIQAIATSATAPDIAYAATRQTVMRTEDGGVTWQPIGVSKRIEMIAIAPGAPEVVYLSDRRQVWRTDDGGDTWRKASAGVAGKVASIYSLTVDPHDPLTVYAATSNGALRSTDGGRSWVRGQGLSFVELVRIAVDPDDTAVLYGAERFRNVWKSVDQGLTWARLATFTNSPNLTDLEFDPFFPGTLYLTANSGTDGAPRRRPTGRVLRSLDRGATWTPVLTTELIHDLAFDPQQPGRIYVATDILGVFRSEDSGITWQPASQDLTAAHCFRSAVDNDDRSLNSDLAKITITPVNDPPVADNDAFDFIGNTELRVDLAPAVTPHVLETTPTAFGVLDGDVDPEGDPLMVSEITVGACTDNTPPFTCTVAGFGSITMDSNGRFSFVPEPGDTSATETFQYTVSDGQPINSTATATVTLTRFERVWYVKNDAPAGGLGRSSDPFDTLAEAQTASLANDYIFVYFGDGTTTGQSAGIALKNGQHLIGEHAGLSLPVNLNGNGAPTNLVAPAAGNRPLLDDTVAGGAQGVAATNLIPAEIVGLNLAGNVNGIDWTTNSTFAGTGTFSIRDNVIRSAANEGVDINLAGTTAVNLAFHDNTLTATGPGLDIQETGTGSLTITRFENNVVSGNTGGTGINVNTATFDAIPGGFINAVNGGMTVIGSAGNGVGGSGLVLSTMTGALSFNDLDIFADGGTGLALGGTGVAATTLMVGAGVGQIVAIGGPAVNASSSTVDLQLSAIQSTNSSTTGVSLSTVNGTVSAGSGSAIANSAGTDFAISGGTANVTYAGTITDDVGLLVSVTGATAGTKSFTGAITDGNDGDGSGISLTSNTGATISFSGGVVLSTGANPALTATGGGTLRVTGSANTIATTTGRALNVANTTIHADGLTFRSISSNGAVNGIILNNTGTSGGLTVSGTGGAGTGGTIQNSTGNGISLTNARDVVLHSMVIDNNDGSGIFGDELTNFTIADSSVTNNATSAAEAGLRFNELLGTGAITNTTVSGSYQDNVRLTPASGVLTNLTITGSTIGPNPAGTGGNGLAIVSSGTADVTVTVSSTTFTGNQTNGFLATSTNTAQLDATLTSSTFTGNNIGIQLSSSLSSDLDFDISDNTFLNHASHAIFVTPGTTATNAAAMVGTIAANSIGDGTADSGSRDGYGIRLDIRGDVTATIAVTGNTIRNTDLEGLFVESRLDNDADAEVGHLDLTLRDNDAGQPDNNSAFPLGAIYGTRVEARNTTVLCLDIAANDAESVGTFEDIQLRQRDTSTFRLERFAGNGAVDTSVEGFVTGENPLIDNADATHSVTFTGVADGFCAKP